MSHSSDLFVSKHPVSRRHFLSLSASALALFAFGRKSVFAHSYLERLPDSQKKAVTLEAFETKNGYFRYKIGKEEAPLIRLKKGQYFMADLKNTLKEPTSASWYGLRIPAKDDSPISILQKTIHPQQSQKYHFKAKDSGTFFIHSRFNRETQMDRGLYAPFIIEEENPPQVDQDLVFTLDDILINEEGRPVFLENIKTGSDEHQSNVFEPVRNHLGNALLISWNEQKTPSIRKNERLRLRLINTSGTRIFSLNLAPLQGWVIARDGQTLPPRPFGSSAWVLAPGMRVDLIVDVPSDLEERNSLTLSTTEGLPLLSFYSTGKEARDRRLPPPKPLESNDFSAFKKEQAEMTPPLELIHLPDKAEDQAFQYHWSSGTEAITQETNASTPLWILKQGKSYALVLTNRSKIPVSIHLEGHSLTFLDEGEDEGLWIDTPFLNPGESKKFGFVAENIGHWTLNCSVLEDRRIDLQRHFSTVKEIP